MKKSSTTGTDKSISQVTQPDAITPSLLKTHWSLTAIKGSAVQNPAEGLSEAYIVFMPDSASLTGSGGCNSLFGSYHLAGNSGIRITQTGSTKMFCDGMDNETRLLNTLREADTYNICGDTLTLKKGGKISLLSFIASRQTVHSN
ncbi:MAG TPA: META domain-containing protein [Bacteroidales bacterium]|nr:META domain-containing protein [Bacteroidales bacterium]HPT11271.1 META domain-containing protein [Bacteroidales bacterium]